MKNFIEELYYGNINPQERYFDRKSETGKSILAIADVEDSLNEGTFRKHPVPGRERPEWYCYFFARLP